MYVHADVCTCVLDVDVFLNCNVPSVGDLDQSVERDHRQKWSVILVVDGDPCIAVGLHITIGTISDLVITRCGRGNP